MNKIEIKLNSAGVRELLKSSAMAAACRGQAELIKARCGAGYMSDTYMGANRVNCSVYPETPEARRDNLQNNTILKAVK